MLPSYIAMLLLRRCYAEKVVVVVLVKDLVVKGFTLRALPGQILAAALV